MATLVFLPVTKLSLLLCVTPCGDDLLAWGAAFCPGVGLLVLETTCLTEGAFVFSACFLGFFLFFFLSCLPASSGWPGLDTRRQNQVTQNRTTLHSHLITFSYYWRLKFHHCNGISQSSKITYFRIYLNRPNTPAHFSRIPVLPQPITTCAKANGGHRLPGLTAQRAQEPPVSAEVVFP